VSSVASARSAALLGGMTANRARLALASALLVLAVVAVGAGSWTAAAWWFVASGIIGLGAGDIALFLAYERLGARLPALMTHCLGAPLGAALEWIWLGNGLHLSEALGILAILLGVGLALAPRRGEVVMTFPGLLLGVISATGLAVSAVVSRQGYAAAVATGAPMPWLDAALLRNLGGLALMLAVIPLWGLLRPEPPQPRPWRQAAPWLGLTALVGPGIGVVCLQAALVTTKAGVVQAIVALVPLLVMPLTWWLEGDRPGPRAILGGLLAVAGVMVMALW